MLFFFWFQKNAQDLLDKEMQECKKLCSTSKLSKLILDEMRVDTKAKVYEIDVLVIINLINNALC